MTETAAIELLKRAVQLDGEQRFAEALNCYSEGIRLLLVAVKGKTKIGEEKNVFVVFCFS